MTTTDIRERHRHRKLTQAELAAEAAARFGPNPWDWAFQCPRCGDIATARDFPEGKRQRLGQDCVGRHCGALKGPANADGRGEATRGCDWTAVGLIRGPWEIAMPDGQTAWGFPLAPAPPQPPQGAAQNPAATPGPASPPDAPDAAVRPACALCGPGDHPEAPWHAMEAAPRDGTEIIGLFGDEEWEIRWAEERRCMIAESYRGTPGIGLFDAGWEQAVEGLAITDEPDAWRPVETAAVPLPSEPYLTSDDHAESES